MDSLVKQLIININILSIQAYDPVEVTNIPNGWNLIGKGNFAAVFSHPALAGKVIKVYAKNREGIKEEIQAYRKLGNHKAYSKLYDSGDCYLILKRLEGVTLYQALKDGLFIPETVIKDVDSAIKYAKIQGLNPTDVHVKNIIMNDEKGYIVDISDFLKPYKCPKWNHFKYVYKHLYLPFYKRFRTPLPQWLLEKVRKAYQVYLRLSGFRKRQSSV